MRIKHSNCILRSAARHTCLAACCLLATATARAQLELTDTFTVNGVTKTRLTGVAPSLLGIIDKSPMSIGTGGPLINATHYFETNALNGIQTFRKSAEEKLPYESFWNDVKTVGDAFNNLRPPSPVDNILPGQFKLLLKYQIVKVLQDNRFGTGTFPNSQDAETYLKTALSTPRIVIAFRDNTITTRVPVGENTLIVMKEIAALLYPRSGPEVFLPADVRRNATSILSAIIVADSFERIAGIEWETVTQPPDVIARGWEIALFGLNSRHTTIGGSELTYSDLIANIDAAIQAYTGNRTGGAATLQTDVSRRQADMARAAADMIRYRPSTVPLPPQARSLEDLHARMLELLRALRQTAAAYSYLDAYCRSYRELHSLALIDARRIDGVATIYEFGASSSLLVQGVVGERQGLFLRGSVQRAWAHLDRAGGDPSAWKSTIGVMYQDRIPNFDDYRSHSADADTLQRNRWTHQLGYTFAPRNSIFDDDVHTVYVRFRSLPSAGRGQQIDPGGRQRYGLIYSGLAGWTGRGARFTGASISYSF